ncbi:MAG: hypothetical protein ACUVUF_08600 [Candidatus Bathycorpusculaceae bacterium]
MKIIQGRIIFILALVLLSFQVQHVYALGENWEIMRGIYLALYAVMGFAIIILLIFIASYLREIKEHLKRLKG